MKYIITLAICLFAAPAMGQDIVGKALALDGDTILVTPEGGKAVKVRLWAVDAPEMKLWPWGPLSRKRLDRILKRGGDLVRCARKGKSYDRVVAVCTNEQSFYGPGRPGKIRTVDIGGSMIAYGYAVEHRVFGRGFYADSESRRKFWVIGAPRQ